MRARLAFLLVSVLALGCSGGGTPTSPTPPPSPVLTIACSGNVFGATTGTSAQLVYAGPTTSGGQAPVTVSCSPASGSTFPVGTTNVACQATDARNATATCTFSATVTRTPIVSRTRFLAFGDSITSGEVTVPITSGTGALLSTKLLVVPSASYPTQLFNLLTGLYTAQVNSLEVTNAGKSGEAALDGALRFPGVMVSVRPEVVLLLEGYNDLALYDAAGISRAIAGIDSMAKEARGRGARVFLASLTPSRPGGRNTLDPALLTQFNARLRTLASGEGSVYVDLYSALLPTVATDIGSDGLHPTEAGYRHMADVFLAAVRATLESP